jgi:uncharacterized membrane protein
MTIGGWIFMFISWAVIITVVVFCYGRTFSSNNNNQELNQQDSSEAE